MSDTLWPDNMTPEQILARARTVVKKVCFLRGDRIEDGVQDVALAYLQGRRGFFDVQLFRDWFGRTKALSKGVGEQEIPLSHFEDQNGLTDWMSETPYIEMATDRLEVDDLIERVETIGREGGLWWKRLAPLWLAERLYRARGHPRGAYLRHWGPFHTTTGKRVNMQLLSVAGWNIARELRKGGRDGDLPQGRGV